MALGTSRRERTKPDVVRSAEPLSALEHTASLRLWRPTLGAIVGRYWWLILLVTAAATAAGVALGLAHLQTYTSTAQLMVGRAGLQQQAVPGYVQASKDLAQAYGRVIISDDVVDPVAKQVGLDRDTARARLSGTPIPNSPVVEIRATGPTAASARALAGATLVRMRDYARQQADTAGAAEKALADYRDIARRATRIQDEIDQVKGDLAVAGGADATRLRNRLNRLQVQLEGVSLEKTTVGSVYSNAKARGDDATALQILRSASPGASDRSSWTQRLGFAGFAGGLIVSLALATALARRRWTRHWHP